MAGKKDLTPEEKLLNVIQSKEGGKTPAAETSKVATKPQPQPPAAPAPPAAHAPTPAPVPPAARPAGEPLKLASTAQAAPSSPRPAPAPASAPAPTSTSAPGPASAPAQSAGKVADDKQESPPKSAQAARTSLKAPGANRMDVRSRPLMTVNRVLRIAIVAMVGLCVWEIWANCSTDAMPVNPPVGRNTGGSTAPAVSSDPCSALLPAFEGKTLFVPVVAEVVESTVTSIVKTALSEVQQYVTRNLNLIGVSPGKDGSIQEAILTDIQTKRNYFLKVGDKITMKNWAIELKQITADHAVFLCGKEEIQVE